MNSSLLRRRFEVIGAIAKKDLKIAFRFPKNFIAVRLIEPLRLFILFGLVYQSFFVFTQSPTLGDWTRENYVPSLLLGAIFYSCFGYAYYRFRWNFINEKYWGTIQIFLTTPISKLDFLIGSSFALTLELSIPILSFLLLFQLLAPVSFFSLLLVLGYLYLMLFGVLGVSLMQGAFSISNENYLFIFDYLYAGWVLFSCFYYADSTLPQLLRFLPQVNPVYHAVELARAVIFHHLSPEEVLVRTGYLLLFAVTVPFLGALFFRKVVRELGVRGF